MIGVDFDSNDKSYSIDRRLQICHIVTDCADNKSGASAHINNGAVDPLDTAWKELLEIDISDDGAGYTSVANGIRDSLDAAWEELLRINISNDDVGLLIPVNNSNH